MHLDQSQHPQAVLLENVTCSSGDLCVRLAIPRVSIATLFSAVLFKASAAVAASILAVVATRSSEISLHSQWLLQHLLPALSRQKWQTAYNLVLTPSAIMISSSALPHILVSCSSPPNWIGRVSSMRVNASRLKDDTTDGLRWCVKRRLMLGISSLC